MAKLEVPGATSSGFGFSGTIHWLQILGTFLTSVCLSLLIYKRKYLNIVGDYY